MASKLDFELFELRVELEDERRQYASLAAQRPSCLYLGHQGGPTPTLPSLSLSSFPFPPLPSNPLMQSQPYGTWLKYTVAHKNNHLNFSLFLCQICINESQSCSNHSSVCVCRGDVASFRQCNKCMYFLENKNLITMFNHNCCSQPRNINATVINENKSLAVNVDKMSQCVLELSFFSSNTSLLSLVPLPDSSVNYVLIKMLPFVHDALTQLFNVIHI